MHRTIHELIDHVMTPCLFVDCDFRKLLSKRKCDVIIMRSNHDDFFIAHFDVTALIMQQKIV